MDKMFELITLRGKQVKNRIVFPPGVCFDPDVCQGMVSDATVKHYERIAKSGCGLIVVEATCVAKNGLITPMQLGVWDDSFINGLARIARAAHEEDVLALLQIEHSGVKTHKSVTYDIVDIGAIQNIAKNFKGVEYRMEFVREIDGVSYFDSSADSTPTQTIAALNTFEEDKKIIILLGGRDKKMDFNPLAPVVYKKAKAAVLYGATKDIIKKCLDDYKNVGDGVLDVPVIQVADNFDSAVMIAKNLAEPGDIVLLSAACTSLDYFKNFEERGKRFKELVKGF